MRIPRPRKKVVVVGCAGLLLALVLLYLAAFPVVEYYAFHIYTPPYSDLSPAKRAEMQARYRAWLSRPIHLPPEALNPQPYSPEMRAAARAFDDAWRENKPRSEKLLSASTKGPDDDFLLLPTCGPEVKALAPLLDAFSAVVRRPDYIYGAFASSWNYSSWLLDNSGYIDNPPLPEPTPSTWAMRHCARLLRLRAMKEIESDQLDAALRDAETLLLAARTDAYDVVSNAFMAEWLCARGSETESEVLRQCENPALLHSALNAQNALVGQLGFFSDRQVLVKGLDDIGLLREFKRRGVKVDYQDRTGCELQALYLQAEAEFLEEKVYPVRHGDAASARWEAETIGEIRAGASLFGAWPRGIAGVKDWVLGPPQRPAIFWGFTQYRPEGWAGYADNLLTRFDLLRLNTARHLYTIEKGKVPDSVADLVPEYLPEAPMDRFAHAKEPIREAGGVYYSIGPDGQDDQGAIVYDPSNGTQSRGDVVLRTLDWTTKPTAEKAAPPLGQK